MLKKGLNAYSARGYIFNMDVEDVLKIAEFVEDATTACVAGGCVNGDWQVVTWPSRRMYRIYVTPNN